MNPEPNEGQLELLADLVLNAGEKIPTISIEAYNGGLMFPTINGKPVRAVVDLTGLEIDSQRKPILKAHDLSAEVGHTEVITNDGVRLLAEGIASGSGPAATQVISSAKSRFPWKASIGIHVDEHRLVAQGESIKVNGRTIPGPFVLVTRSKLKEISAVTIGGDDSSSLSIAASAAGVTPMDQTDPNVEVTQTSADAATATVTPQIKSDTLQASASNDVTLEIQQLRAARASESLRITKIETLCAKHGEIAAEAIAGGWSVEKAELAVLRAERPKAPAALIRENVNTPDVLSAALCMAGGLSGLEKSFDAKTLDTANRQYKGGSQISLQRLLLQAAHANGYHGQYFDTSNSGMADILRAAFSTRDIAGVLSNTANKFVVEGYNFVDQSWRQISRVKPVKDFKAITSYRLTDNSEFEEVPAEGMIPHGELDDTSFTNQAKTYGKMYGLSRQDIINDDLGVLDTLRTRLGRGGAIKLNKVFWASWVDDAAFFSDSNSPDNLAAQTLGISGLSTVKAQFMAFTDSESNPLGATPRILLVPPALEELANQLVTTLGIVSGNTTAALNSNPHAGKYRVVVSPYLTDTNAWYLLADPMDIAGIETVFLNGVQAPTVEVGDQPFNMLGIQIRGYFDFGVAKQDFRAGVKSNPS